MTFLLINKFLKHALTTTKPLNSIKVTMFSHVRRLLALIFSCLKSVTLDHQ